ncbi:MAG: hypothetical protein EAZ89_03925 [Bacteroidetes bacterium]|nr:MAG: hypothetical protein EAZ89_03925 [Bacteroidota bacterium]
MYFRLLSLCFLLAAGLPAHGWGFWAHQRINRLAIFTLPPEMIVLYKANIEYITNHAVDPDMRRYAVDDEAGRHFMDLDRYGSFPFDSLPRRWKDAVARYSEDSLRTHGMVPYQLPMAVYQLKEAFERKDLQAIMDISADMGHYVGDAHVPLHTTSNYNGQFTGQKGIHGFWESRIPELFGEKWNFFVGRCYYINDIYAESWQAVLESHLQVDSVLGIEKQLSKDFPADRKYGYESRNQVVMRVYSREYTEAYNKALDGMVERRMRASIRRIGSYWYTAWKMAGSPDLSELAKQQLSDRPQRMEVKLKIFDRESQDIGAMMLRPGADMCCGNHSGAALAMGWQTMDCARQSSSDLSENAAPGFWKSLQNQLLSWWNSVWH